MMVLAPVKTTDILGPAPRDERGRFRNLVHHAPHSSWSALRWFATRRPEPWPKLVPGPIGPKPVARVSGKTIRATLIGHATVLVRSRAQYSDGSGLVGARQPAVLDRPQAGASAGDCFRRSTENRRRIAEPQPLRSSRPVDFGRARSPRPAIGSHRARRWRDCAGRASGEHDWWQSHDLGGGVVATYVPAQHFSARTPFDRNKTLWGGFVLETSAGVIYFAGDTGDGPHIAAIADRFGPMTLSLLPIGAYLPHWFMAPVHIAPAEAVAATETLQSVVTLPIHFDTFRLADDAFGEAVRILRQALDARKTAGRPLDFRVPDFGDAIEIGG